MRATVTLLAMGLAIAPVIGCRNTPPPMVQVPSESGGNPYSTYNHEQMKPLPPTAGQPSAGQPSAPQPPADSGSMTMPPPPAARALPAPPSVSQAYVDAYDRVGRPRLFVLTDKPDQPGPTLVPGDYDLIERVVRDTLSGGGLVATIPPSIVHDKLNPTQIRDAITAGGPALATAGATLHADVMVEVKVANSDGQTLLTGTARNARDGQQLTTVVSTISAASPRSQIDFASRLLGERMINGLTDSWDRWAQPQTPAAPSTSSTPATPSSTPSSAPAPISPPASAPAPSSPPPIPAPPPPAPPTPAPPTPAPPTPAPPATTPPPPPPPAVSVAPAPPASTPGTQPAHP